MTVEVATFLGDLVPTNPGSSDIVSQGDDHLRLLKLVLQNTFPSVEKAFYFPTTLAKSADFTVTAAQMSTTFLVTTTGGLINMTLPTLSTGDAGWECWLMKVTTDVNPVMVKPPSGTLTSGAIPALSAARRCIPSSKVSCYWTGTNWVIGRSQGLAGPVGSAIEYHGSTLPFGYEWPNGQTLSNPTTSYPEYNAVIGSGITLDKRSRLGIPLDNLGGSAAGRLAGGIITGTAIGNVGGTDTVTLDKTMIPTGITSNGTNAITVVTAVSVIVGSSGFQNGVVGASGSLSAPPSGSTSISTVSSTGTNAISVTSNNTGGLAHPNLQPSIMVAQLLVVE